MSLCLPYAARRYLVALDGSGRDEALMHLRGRYGLRVGSSGDFALPRSPAAPGLGEVLLLDALDVALVNAPPDLGAELAGRGRAAFRALAPERSVRVASAPAGSPVGAPASRPAMSASTAFTDDDEATWGVHAVRAATSSFRGRGIRVAVLDSGIDATHPDLCARVAASESFVADGSTQDRNGHGTFSAGILAGPTRPCTGPRYGVASEAQLYVAKVLDDDGGGTDADVLVALDWAVRNGCAVASLSLGTPASPDAAASAVFEHAAARALQSGTLLLSAAGNGSQRPDQLAPVVHPANCESVVAVGAIGPRLAVAAYSAAGLRPPGGVIGLVAPGIGVRSASIRAGGTEIGGGTSTAAAFAAAVAVLLAEASPGARGPALASLLRSTALLLPWPGRDAGTGLAQAPN